MKILQPLILAGLVLLGIFTLANWSVLSAPTTLSFVAFHLEAPLGLLLLGMLLLFVALFTAYVLVLRTTMLMDARHYARELESQQQLANKAEASRLTELRAQIDREFVQLRETADTTRTDLGTRIEGMESALRSSIEETGRSLSAYIGEVDDKLDRNMARPAAE
ncbi:MAG: LapA family protein [Thiobacillus sp.]|nr:LapA family protein [Thiobacillus sp.]